MGLSVDAWREHDKIYKPSTEAKLEAKRNELLKEFDVTWTLGEFPYAVCNPEILTTLLTAREEIVWLKEENAKLKEALEERKA